MGNQVTLEILSEELDIDMELLTTMSYVIDGKDDYSMKIVMMSFVWQLTRN
jgi:hypothetical protein